MARLDLEHKEQCALFDWAEIQAKSRPELSMLMAIPTGGHRHIAVAKKLKAEGTKRGVPDILLAVPRKACGGLWIELKKPSGGTVSKEQRDWIARLNMGGYQAEVCHGWDEAREVILKYLG